MQVQWWRCVLCGCSGDQWGEVYRWGQLIYMSSGENLLEISHLSFSPAGWLVTMSDWSCACPNCAFGELCYLCLLYCYSFYVLLARSMYLYMNKIVYKHLWYVQMALLYVCFCVCYWLLTVWYAIGWMSVLINIHLCRCHIDMDALMSMFVCHYITISL